MKRFQYDWDSSIFLLHVQLTRSADDSSAPVVESEGAITRAYEGGLRRSEPVTVAPDVKSHRFIVSRTHPKEVAFHLDYPKELTLEVFKIDDRAYYPTESFFVG